MKLRKICTAIAVVATLGAHGTAAFGDEERLPWGAIKAGNKEGTIPAYTGGLPDTTNPPGFKKDSGFWADPFAKEEPLYTITGANMAQYADKLSEGVQELLKRYPTFRVSVYPTHRSVSYPDWVIENTKKNAAGRCKLIENGLAVTGCFGGIPFPQPKNGYEAMWNHQLHYLGHSMWNYAKLWYVDASGNKVMTGEVNNRQENPYYNRDMTPESFYAAGGQFYNTNNIYTAPARIVGEGNMQKKTVNPVANPDRTWNYQPGQRRVRLSPDYLYDAPLGTSGGAMLVDEIFVYSGMLDRFDWKVVDEKEMIVPYNAYRWYNAKADELLQKNHQNPDLMRWELHRVYVVEATLKPGQRHVHPKKRFYFDEDCQCALLMDGWDAAGKISKGLIAPIFVAYDKKIGFTGFTAIYNFNTGIYFHSSLAGDSKGIFFDIDKVDFGTYYTPDGLARRTQR
ncbi:putative protein DUF1329 [Aromatoleum petrolei]|nr:putative protein DUF1329 [Aromatoleum petrolei]